MKHVSAKGRICKRKEQKYKMQRKDLFYAYDKDNMHLEKHKKKKGQTKANRRQSH